MPGFTKTTGAVTSPFGVNEFLRSWQDVKTTPYTASAAATPALIRDGNPGQKILNAGSVMAKITSGPEAGKIGPFQPAGTAATQTITPSGTWTATTGTFKLSVAGSTNAGDVINPVALVTAAALTTLLQAMPSLAAFVPVATGGPLNTGAFTITFGGGDFDAAVPNLVFSATNVIGGTSPNAAVAAGTTGVAGAADGRQTAANIVGLVLTSVPWQLYVRDKEVSIVYEASVVQGWCTERDVNGNEVVLSNTTAAYMQRGGAAGKTCDITFN